MQCKTCHEPTTKNPKLCDQCIVKTIEKRAAKTRTKTKLFKNAKTAIITNPTLPAQVNLHLYKKLITITKNSQILKKKPQNPENYDFIFTPETAEQLAENLLKRMLKSEKNTPTNTVTLLGDSTISEITHYANVKKIKHEKNQKQTYEQTILTKIETKYPGTTRSLAKTSKQLFHTKKNSKKKLANAPNQKPFEQLPPKRKKPKKSQKKETRPHH